MRILFLIVLAILLKQGYSQNIKLLESNFPTDIPLIFAPDFISTEQDESLIGIFNNGNYIIFDRIPKDFKDWSNYPVYICKNVNGYWNKPELTKFLGKPWYYNYPNPENGTEIFYASWLPLTETGEVNDLNINKVKFENNEWSKSQKLSYPINTSWIDTWPSISKNGTLYFFSNRDGGYGQADIYNSVPNNGQYNSVQNMGNVINSEAWEHDPCISADESFLIYSSNKEGSFGKDDLYISFQYELAKWTCPINLGENINSSFSDNRPYLSPNEKILFFTSTRDGDLDIYWVSTSFIDQIKKNNLIGKYCGQKEPGLMPEIFLPGYLNNDTLGAFCSVFSPDMQEFYLVRLKTNGSTPGVIVSLKKESGAWYGIDTLPFTSGVYHDNDMCISTDGNKMFFRSFRALPNGIKPKGHTYLWFAERIDLGWNDAKPLYCGGELVISGYPSITKNGTLYFRSQKDGKAGIYRSKYIDKKYSEIEFVYSVIDSIATEGDMFIAPDESYMIISCNNHPENLQSSNGDLYVVFKNKNGGWTKAINLGNTINTDCIENCPAVTPDGKYLFYNRYCEETNIGNIYWVDADIINQLKPNYIN